LKPTKVIIGALLFHIHIIIVTLLLLLLLAFWLYDSAERPPKSSYSQALKLTTSHLRHTSLIHSLSSSIRNKQQQQASLSFKIARPFR